MVYTAGAIGACYTTWAGTLDATNSTTAANVMSGGLAVAKSEQIGTTLTTGGNITCNGSNFLLNPASGNSATTLSCASGSTNYIYAKVNGSNVAIIGMNAASPFYLVDPANGSWTVEQYTPGAVGAGYITFAGTLDASNATTASHVISGGVAIAKSVDIGTTLTLGNSTATFDTVKISPSGAGSNTYVLNIVPATMSTSSTLTIPALGATDTFAMCTLGNAFTGNNTMSGSLIQTNTTGIKTLYGATKDAIAILGRNGGSSSYTLTLSPGSLTNNTTVTIPYAAATDTIATLASANTFTGSTTFANSQTTINGGTSSSTLTSSALNDFITFSGAFTAGPVSAVSGTVTYSGNTAQTAVTLNGGYFSTSATGTLTNTPIVSAVYGSTTVNPNGASTAIYNGLDGVLTVTSSASNYLAASTLQGGTVSATFNGAETASATILAALNGMTIAPSVALTNASGANTITALNGVNLNWGTVSQGTGGTITYTTIDALNGGTLATSGLGTVNCTTFYGANLGGLTMGATAGTFATYYGCYLATPTVTNGTITTRYGLYQSDVTARNVFLGNFGYGTGAGTAQSQTTNRTTTVVANTSCGAITMYSAAGSATPASFTVTDSKVAATDVILLSVASGATNTYNLAVTTVGAGSFVITYWTTGGTSTDAPVINFVVIKGASS